ncbi:MAG: mycoredoxin-dependent peroxiredoxin [Nocardioidaceae bacterium]|nr:mycoredoxin-dependent peroxiredoxin [Nocardioidaceae bacterium]
MAVDIGAPAPDFTLPNQHGESVSLETFRGRKDVVLVFYPFAFSGVCTGELRQLRDDFADLSGETTELLAISCDPLYSLRAYADRDGYEFSLLSDFWPHGEVTRAYNTFNSERGCAFRLTVVVDRERIVRWQVENSMGAARDPAEYRAAISTLR